jgi:uncharacterized protein DUF3999
MSSAPIRFALLTLVVLAAQAGAQPLERRQFAVGWSLDLPAESGYFEIPLTLDVYQNAPSIEQLAVLDADDVPMPFYRVPAAAPEATERRTVLPASPLYAAQAPDIAQLNVATDGGRTNVTVTRPDVAATDVVAFVIDARASDVAPFAIELDWRELAQPFLLEATVEQSADLTSWRPVGRGSIAALAVGSERARHSRVPVRASAGGYYRVSWNRGVPDWYLRAATLLSSDTPPPPFATARFRPLAPEAIAGTAGDDAPLSLYFDVGGPVPVSAVTLDFAAGNGWADAAVATSDSLSGPWRAAATEVLFYELDYAGQQFASEPLALARREARYWRFRSTRPFGAAQVELEVRYPRDTLRFSAEGRAPYVLAAGTFAAAAGPDPTFADVWRQLRPSGAPLEPAVLGAREDLGGAAALVAPFVFPWRSAMLWIVLAAGVLAVSWMAVRLAREMHEKKPPEVPPGSST